ncbi:MAG: tetrathionate reductase family octaheme c-type cytochrome [Puniceicoccaceae bacterium]
MNPKMIALLIGGLCMSGPLMAQHASISEYNGYASCKSCHDQAFGGGGLHADQVMASIHWTWEKTDSFTGKEVGKYNVINNYCVAVKSNEPRCTSCHVGIGWSDTSWDPAANRDSIDCLVCHDTTGTYKKIPTGAGAPVDGLDYAAITSSIGSPDRDNCGACHFFGGGGDAVKHGTLDSTMANPTRDADVHMGGSMDMTCIDCHIAEGASNKHEYLGTRYSQDRNDAALCQDCHTATPHGGFMDNHAQRVACQTCHIPAFARGGKATKMFWDWTTAKGEKVDDGNGNMVDLVIKDDDGNVLYHAKKGTFEWQENVIPEYVWANGKVRHVTLDDPVMEGEVVMINELQGDVDDPTALIFPVKRFTGIQPYDTGLNGDGVGNLAIPHLFPFAGEKEWPADQKSAFWMLFDWEKALTAGMEADGRTFDGPVGYIETEFTWISNHMVAPKEQSLDCVDCHTFGSRMNFAKLGYPEERAQELQLKAQSDYWAGYPVTPEKAVDTGAWLGWMNVTYGDWVYSYSLGKYLYLPEAGVTEAGAWTYIMK